MNVHYPADWAVHGGPPFEGPTDESLLQDGADPSVMAVAFSEFLGSWVIVDHLGNVHADGTPAELSVWMTAYLTHLQMHKEACDWNDHDWNVQYGRALS